jgi:hypothetical protein
LCGDSLCCAQSDENPCSCTADCGAGTCDDGTCCPATGESTCACPLDCGLGSCGDGLCCADEDEDGCTCPADCGAGTCGDTICCANAGEDSDSCPEDCGAGCPNTADGLWLTTAQDVSGSGIPGLDGWSAGSLLQLGDPGLAFEPGTSGGTLTRPFDLDAFAADGDTNVIAVHRVKRDVAIGASNPIQLTDGDLLLAVDAPEVLTAANSLTVAANDVFVFRPDDKDDYSTGSFFFLLDGTALVQTQLLGLTLVERETAMPDVTLAAGTFLLSQQGPVQSKFIYSFTPTTVGQGSTTGDRQVFIQIKDLGTGAQNPVTGVELLEQCESLGNVVLQRGSLLVSLQGTIAIVDLGGEATPRDILVVQLTSTHQGSGITTGSISWLMQGADLSLDTSAEDLSGLCMIR